MFPINQTFRLLDKVIRNDTLTKETGATFASRGHRKKFLNRKHTGLLMNGADLRLTDTDSFRHVCVVARTGFGKTSGYIIPNIIDRSRFNSSIVVNDPSGEAYAQTSGFMKANGFDVIVINPGDPVRSHRFNPLLEIQDIVELEQMARIIIEAGALGAHSSDPFWNQGATRLVTYLLKTLLNASREHEEYFSLANLYHLLQNFGSDGSGLADYIGSYTINPHNPGDTSLRDEWIGQISGNEKTLQSFLSTALVCLQPMTNPNLGFLTAKSTVDLTDLRRRKTVLYFITPSQHADYYSFFTSLFFQSLFNMSMRNIPTNNELPIYVLFDEFAHSKLPTIVGTANTIRKFKVSLSIILQTITQLDEVYGQETANAIRGGFSTYMTFGGSDVPTCEYFEKTIGQVRQTTKKGLFDRKAKVEEFNLINQNDIRTMDYNSALMVQGNQDPVMMEITRHFENPGFRQALACGEYDYPMQQNVGRAQLVPLTQ